MMKHGRAKLIIIFAVFLGPLLASFIWYYGFDAEFAPRARTNHAPLISPPLALGAFTNTDVDGARFDYEMLAPKWSMFHALPESCGADCEQSLYHTRQVHRALGRNASRMRRILLSANRELLQRIKADHPDAVLLIESQHGIEKQLAPVFKRRGIDGGGGDALLIDPLGNVMLVIPAGIDPSLLLKDLKKLLRVSRIG